jgi:hypothetical protein
MKNRFDVLNIFLNAFSAMIVFFQMSAFANTLGKQRVSQKDFGEINVLLKHFHFIKRCATSSFSALCGKKVFKRSYHFFGKAKR